MTTLETLVHELRQPLTAILSNAQAAQRLLATGELNASEAQEILEEIVACERRAAGILKQLEAAIKGPTGSSKVGALTLEAQGDTE